MAESQQNVSRSNAITIEHNEVGNWNLYVDSGTGLRRPTNISFQMSPPCTMFYGRDDELSKLHTYMQNYRRVAVLGDYQVGKRNLALEYARIHANYFDKNVIVVKKNQPLQATLLEVALELGIPSSQGTVQRNFSSIMADIRQFFADKKCLLILMNAEDDKVWKVLKELQEAWNIHILVTSTQNHTHWKEFKDMLIDVVDLEFKVECMQDRLISMILD